MRSAYAIDQNRDTAVPIPINFNEVEIGAVLVTFDQKKSKTRAVLIHEESVP